ncbi:vacuolar assembly protein-like protein [Calycina marina]|uniref:Vacuolar assembly protein-like protein n=1 Tax=Calycina marina TaxID=1763456 RepID=A0A9P8CC59_9HELO|nr:vacuolar assembly protein-like protein [Calycina marina]
MRDSSMASGSAKKGGEDGPNRDEKEGVNDEESGSSTEEGEDDGDEDEDEDDEPKLKYARLTGQLGAVYRNGDATSAFLVAGDKMIIGTHNGNIHVLSLPSFQSLRVYHAHSASISSISISPFPTPRAIGDPEGISRIAAQTPKRAPSIASQSSSTPRTPKTPKTPLVANVLSNAIYIATSSIDGNVCIASLVDQKDVQLRNFARPVQAVALSPDYKNDKAYVSGGLAGNLVLTVGGRTGSSTSTTTGSASATAAGWLGTIGLGGNDGRDSVLHSGEGAVHTIKWSLTGKYVAWINEYGVKIMRSNLHLESADAESAWKRIGHVPRPEEEGWDEMAGVWKGRIEWIDETTLETDEDDKSREANTTSPATARLKQQTSKNSKRIEKLLIGWGGTIWIINVHPGVTGVGKHVGERSAGQAEIIKILRMDCIISGLSLYTPTLLIVLAYIPPGKEDEDEDEDEDKNEDVKGHKSKGSTASTGSEPSGGIRHRQNALSPELRLIDLGTSQEVDTDGLTVSRFERLSAADYHLGVLPAARAAPVAPTSRGTLETLTGMGSGMWNATINATALLSSAASIRSTGSQSDKDSRAPSSVGALGRGRNAIAHPHIVTPGMKIFIHSPYDCILSTKRDLSDHLSFLLAHQKYRESWELIEEHPEVISSSAEKLAEIGPGASDLTQASSEDFSDDTSSIMDTASRLINSSVEKEKRRIGEMWVHQLIEQGDWTTAGETCGRVLGTSVQWKDWVYRFVAAKKFDEITPYIPTTQAKPPLEWTIYEVILGHYIANDRPMVRRLLESWSPDLFDVQSVTRALENQLKYRDVREDSVQDGIKGRDWKIIIESMGKLYLADGRPREALKCYFKLQDADTVMRLIKEYHLLDAVVDDIPGLILLRVTKDQEESASIEELQNASSEAINLLVDEAQHGIVRPEVVVGQLKKRKLPLYLFFYLKALWTTSAIEEDNYETRERLVSESRALVDEVADLAVHLFALYDRQLLMQFVKSSTEYTLEKATAECEELDYVPELVYLYSKTGRTKKALYLIIDRLGDVSQAILFAKQQDDKDLWENLLEYSMNKPQFIRGLLEEVGTAIDPITLVRRIPEGLEIEGLKDGLSRMVKEYEIQHSISYGVAKVLRGGVSIAQSTLRSGQRKGVKFDIIHKKRDHLDLNVYDVPTNTGGPEAEIVLVSGPESIPKPPDIKAGHCVGCNEPFTENEVETLVGFACGHVFHLPHLLTYENDDRPDTPPAMDFDEVGQVSTMHSVAAKVTHARLLRDKIRDGCPVARCNVTKILPS